VRQVAWFRRRERGDMLGSPQPRASSGTGPAGRQPEAAMMTKFRIRS
jgi:hypothetical protein